MSTSTISHASSPVTDDERSKRLNDAGAYWSEAISKDTANAQLTYKVKGSGFGSVATRVQAGKHFFDIDEPAGVAGDDAAASPVEIRLTVHITGPDSGERYQELRQVVDANCPVLDLFANPTPIKVNLIANR